MTKTYRYTTARTMTPYEATKAWNARRKVMREKHESSQTDAVNQLSSAMLSKSDGSITLAAQRAIARLSAETKARAATAAKQATQNIDSYKSNLKESSIVGGLGKLDSGTTLNLDGDSLTLSDGTTLNIKTGLKVNVTV